MPAVGARVSVRYRLPDGAEPPFSEAIGWLEALTPRILLRTRGGELLSIERGDVVALREVPHRAVRTSEIRELHRAIAAATPALEQDTAAGWLVRHGDSVRGNYAAPLDVSATVAGFPEVLRWFDRFGEPVRLLLPDRTLPVRVDGGEAMLVFEGESREGALPDGVQLTEVTADGVTRAYLAVPADDPVAVAFAGSAGFRLHHGYRFVAPSVLLPTI